MAILSKEEARIEKIIPELNALHRECKKTGLEMLNYAVQAGALLVQLKESVKHGEFEKTVERRCNFGLSTAKTYIKLSESWKEIKEDVGPDSTISGCLKLIPPRNEQNRQSLTISPKPGGVGGKSERGDEAKAGNLPQTDGVPVNSQLESDAACIRGGQHEYDEEACIKCHDPIPAAKEPPPQVVEEPIINNPFKVADGLFGQLIRCINACKGLDNKDPTQIKLHGDVTDSLHCAYEDFGLWKKAVRK